MRPSRRNVRRAPPHRARRCRKPHKAGRCGSYRPAIRPNRCGPPVAGRLGRRLPVRPMLCRLETNPAVFPAPAPIFRGRRTTWAAGKTLCATYRPNPSLPPVRGRRLRFCPASWPTAFPPAAATVRPTRPVLGIRRYGPKTAARCRNRPRPNCPASGR